MSTDSVPVVDVSAFLSGSDAPEDCAKIYHALRTYGCVVIRDPRVREEDNEEFLDMIEKYFEQPDEVKLKDARPEYHYEVGVTPSHKEYPRDNSVRIATKYIDMCRPLKPSGPDPKWRYFWRMGERAEQTDFPQLNAEPVIPAAFPQWPDVMNKWGSLMLTSVLGVAEMLALGMGLQRDTFTSRMYRGNHLLAPTASDLSKHGAEGTILAGFHYDLNFLTIHGKSRYPGLNIFLRDDSDAPRKKVAVRVPDGCLLVQAGKMLEWYTAADILAGFHEVIVTPDTVKKIEAQRAAGKSLWRISSTLFSHINADQTMEPLPEFAGRSEASEYPPIKAGQYVTNELMTIKLAV